MLVKWRNDAFSGSNYLIFIFHLGPRLDFDPDIVAALDDDFDFDDPANLLEDDFILQANKPTEEEEGMDVRYVWFVSKQDDLTAAALIR